VLVAVVVVVAGARALTPAALCEPGLRGDIFERAVTPVPVEMIRRLLPFGKAFERGAVDEEDVGPSVRVVVEHGGAAAGRLEQVLVRLLPAEYRRHRQTGFARDVLEREPERLRSLTFR